MSILDHIIDEESVPVLVAALDDDDIDVRRRALHALACEQCKQDDCRPGEDLFVPRALEFLAEHASADLRAAAVDALGKVARRRADVAVALARAADRDPHPGIRNMARVRIARLPA